VFQVYDFQLIVNVRKKDWNLLVKVKRERGFINVMGVNKVGVQSFLMMAMEQALLELLPLLLLPLLLGEPSLGHALVDLALKGTVLVRLRVRHLQLNPLLPLV
jgi:hypothetical protein